MSKSIYTTSRLIYELKRWIRRLFLFVSSRQQVDLDNMYENYSQLLRI